MFSGFTPPEERVSSLEGNSYLDAATGAPPWTRPSNYLSNLSDTSYEDEPLSTDDTPLVSFSDDCVLSGNGMTDVPVDGAAIVLNFQLYVAAKTTDAENGADSVYVQIGMANWQFNGSGVLAGANTFSYGVWTSSAPKGDGNTGDTSFRIITTGATVPITTGVTANQATQSKAWTTEPPFPQ